jgi:hypothetical protein
MENLMTRAVLMKIKKDHCRALISELKKEHIYLFIDRRHRSCTGF